MLVLRLLSARRREANLKLPVRRIGARRRRSAIPNYATLRNCKPAVFSD